MERGSLELFVRDKMLSLQESFFPPFFAREVDAWLASAEVRETISLLSECLENNPFVIPNNFKKALNKLAVYPSVSMILAILDRFYLDREHPILNILSLLDGIARDQFIGSLAYVMATFFEWTPPAEVGLPWKFLRESFAYFIVEQVTPEFSG